MVGHDVAAGPGAGAARVPRVGGRIVAGLGMTAVLAVAAALLVALLGGTASAQTPPGPRPYGGALDQVDPSNQITSEEALEVGMLGLGTLNGVAFAIAMIASRLRGPTTAQTRRALITRTGAGTVSESRRERRERERNRTAGPGPATPGPATPGPATSASVAPAPAAPAGGPRSLAPRTPPEGAVPAQGGPAPREALVPAGRAPAGPPGPRGPEDTRGARPPQAPDPRVGVPRPATPPASPPADVAAPLRPAVRR